MYSTILLNKSKSFISNLSISASGTSNVGLFGVTGSAARILDLGIENANVSGNNYVGVIAGKSSGTITNCYVKGNVKVTSLNGYSGVIASYSTNTIQSCYTSGSVTVDGGNGSYIRYNCQRSYLRWRSCWEPHCRKSI